MGNYVLRGRIAVPVDEDSYYYYTGVTPRGGTLWLEGDVQRFHAHQRYFQRAFFLVGEARDALPPALHANTDCRARPTSLTPFGRNAAIARTLASGPWVCDARRRVVVADGQTFDRASDVACRPWRFARGDPFTVLSLHGPPSGDVPGEADDLAHTAFYLFYVADDARTHVGGQRYLSSRRVDDVPIYPYDDRLRACPASRSSARTATLAGLALFAALFATLLAALLATALAAHPTLL